MKGIIISVEQISLTEVELAHPKGIVVVVYTNQSKQSNIEAIEKNVDFIQTDHVKYLIKLLE